MALGVSVLGMADSSRVRGIDGMVLLEGLATVHLRSCVYYCEGLAMNPGGLEETIVHAANLSSNYVIWLE